MLYMGTTVNKHGYIKKSMVDDYTLILMLVHVCTCWKDCGS